MLTYQMGRKEQRTVGMRKEDGRSQPPILLFADVWVEGCVGDTGESKGVHLIMQSLYFRPNKLVISPPRANDKIAAERSIVAATMAPVRVHKEVVLSPDI